MSKTTEYLENQIVDLEDQVSDLEEQVSSLEYQVLDLQYQVLHQNSSDLEKKPNIVSYIKNLKVNSLADELDIIGCLERGGW